MPTSVLVAADWKQLQIGILQQIPDAIVCTEPSLFVHSLYVHQCYRMLH